MINLRALERLAEYLEEYPDCSIDTIRDAAEVLGHVLDLQKSEFNDHLDEYGFLFDSAWDCHPKTMNAKGLLVRVKWLIDGLRPWNRADFLELKTPQRD